MFKNILVVDDDASIRDLVVLILHDFAGCERVDMAPDGMTALEMVTAKFAHGMYDAVVTDLDMPQLSGEILAMRLREMGFKGRIIMMTGHNERRTGNPKSLGVDVVLHKPFKIEDLLAALYG